MPRKKKTAAPATAKKEAPLTKAAFIRLHPNKKAAEVVALAKAQGMTLSVPHVYVVRTKVNAKGKKAPKAGRPAAAKHAPKAVVHTTHNTHKAKGGALHADYDYEKRVRDIIFHVGFDGLKRMVDKIHHELAG